MKFELLKLSLCSKSLPSHLRVFINQFLPQGYQSLTDIIRLIKNGIDKQIEVVVDNTDPKLISNWRGTRMEVELPLNKS